MSQVLSVSARVDQIRAMTSYCDSAPGHPLHGPYHDTEYGFSETDETVLMERLAMEIFQAGLNWSLILQKRDGMRAAFDGYAVDKVAAYGDADAACLLGDQRIVRNRLKVNAIIHNARVIQGFRGSHGGFANWIAAHHPLPRKEWVRLFRKTFKFTGGEITGEFLMSIGYLPGAHVPECPVYQSLVRASPPWVEAGQGFYADE